MPSKQPNFLVIWGDDIGYWNFSAYNQGMMGYKTPNVDRIAEEGGLFTDWYGQQSCTAGRAAFITGQSGFRTGMLKVGLPGAKEGLQARDVTIAELFKDRGYQTAQFGKNHLGDADETLPTAHGFDEFFGSLYHLNAEDEPEHPDYFKNPELQERYATRGVLHTWANPDRTQRIESTGPLTKKRMETIDNWKIVFAEQRAHGMGVWEFPFTQLRLPKLFNLRSDPFERADQEGMDYQRWRAEHLFVLVPAQEFVAAFLTTFPEFPPSQKVGSFSLDNVLYHSNRAPTNESHRGSERHDHTAKTLMQ